MTDQATTEKVWPIDEIGNPIRKGDLIRMALSDPAVMLRVTDVTPASAVSTEGQDKPLLLDGAITLYAQLTITYSPGQIFRNVLVVKDPEAGNLIRPAPPGLVV